MARVYTKIGDVFSVKIDGNGKKYFQLIAYDQTQLNSDVIRAFKKVYPIDANPDLAEIVNGEVDFYAHCVTKWGVKMGLWGKVGSIKDVGDLKKPLFRDTNDYGIQVDGSLINISHNWYVWRINDENFTWVGRLERTLKTYAGLIINPVGIIELLKGNKYPINYPDL